MKLAFIKIIFIICILAKTIVSYSQNSPEITTIKIKKERIYVKAAFDESNYKVVALDKFGNPHENAITSFSIFYKEGKKSYEATVDGNVFPKKTIDFLTKKKKSATKVCLTKLKAADENNHVEELPDLCDIVIFPDCKKINKIK